MNPLTFTAIDFETAQGYHHSICQVGIVRVREGEVIDTLSLLVKPPNNEYWWQNTQVHGLTAQDTADAPTFDQVWPQIRGWIADQTLVAHNMSFDGSCLRRALSFYGLEPVSYHAQCTCRLYGRKGLSRLCEQHGIPLQHHDALSDARACAELYLRHLRR